MSAPGTSRSSRDENTQLGTFAYGHTHSLGLVAERMVEDPLVRRRAHGDGADAFVEPLVGERPVLVARPRVNSQSSESCSSAMKPSSVVAV